MTISSGIDTTSPIPVAPVAVETPDIQACIPSNLLPVCLYFCALCAVSIAPNAAPAGPKAKRLPTVASFAPVLRALPVLPALAAVDAFSIKLDIPEYLLALLAVFSILPKTLNCFKALSKVEVFLLFQK